MSYVAHYADAVGREIAVANYGTNGGTALTRSSIIPARSDTILISSAEYNDAGEAYKTIDPADKEDRTEFDNAGRIIRTIENYTDGDPTTGGNDEDVTVEFTYTPDGRQATMTAKQKNAADDQTTQYVYGTTLSDSDVARNDLLRAVIYPDSDDSGIGVPPVLSDGADGTYDRVEHRYNRQGELIETKDQNETVHALVYDNLGRHIHDRVTTLGTGIDGAVRRISTTYAVLGQIEKVTSYDDAVVGSGDVVNEVLRQYNGLGLLDREYQEHNGTKDANTPYVGYNYDMTGSAGEFTRGLRAKSIRYPNGRLVHYTYGTSGSDADNLNRLDAIKDNNSGSPGDTLASYTYLGLGQMVIEDLEEPEVRLDYFGGTSGRYAGFDAFNRVIDQRWHHYGTGEHRDRFKYGYDRASNRTRKENVVSKNLATPVYLDEFYTYDGMHRLKNFDRGELNGTKTGITGTPSREEDWMLDPLGNWSNYIQKTSGTTDLNQGRTPNKANEFTNITESTGTSWPTPSYDRNGNMTSMPQPTDLGSSYYCIWDAWNRLIKVKDGATTIAEYRYDGMLRRITKSINSTGRHFYYSNRWQVLEEQIDSSTNADRQFIWGPLYIDHLILRDRDTSDPANGTLDERVYGLQDGNWNVTGLIGTAGDSIERFAYQPYGPTDMFDASFGSITSSNYDWEYRFTGHRVDDETGFSYFRVRFLTGELGCFLGRDPVGYTGNLNLYQYVSSSPLSLSDPFGLTKVISASGINDDGKQISADVKSYIDDRRVRQQLTDEQLSYTGHRTSTIKNKHLVQSQLQDKGARTAIEAAERLLNVEAFQMAGVNRRQGEFCGRQKTKIGIVMVAPKTRIDTINDLLRNAECCCDVQILVFRDEFDAVVNPHGIRPGDVGRENWVDKQDSTKTVPNTVEVLIGLGGALHHGWEGRSLRFGTAEQEEAYRKSHTFGSPFSSHNVVDGSMFARDVLDNFKLKSYTADIDAALSADKDIGYVCHSQGCNIVAWEIARACLK